MAAATAVEQEWAGLVLWDEMLFSSMASEGCGVAAGGDICVAITFESSCNHFKYK